MRSLVDPASAAGFLVLGEMRPRSEELHPVSLELTGKARELADLRAAGGGGGTVTALVLAGDRLPDPKALVAAGADRVRTGIACAANNSTLLLSRTRPRDAARVRADNRRCPAVARRS